MYPKTARRLTKNTAYRTLTVIAYCRLVLFIVKPGDEQIPKRAILFQG